MRKRFFIKNLLIFMLPLLVPLLLLGTFSIYTFQNNAEKEFIKSNINFIRQSAESVESVLTNVDSIKQTFIMNYEVVGRLKNILSTPKPTLDEYNNIVIIKNFLNASVLSMPYLNSIYVYFNNTQGNFLTTTDGLKRQRQEDYYDSIWYDSVKNTDLEKESWTALRNIKRYSFEKEPTEVLTIYKRIYSYGFSEPDGVILFNVQKKYIQNKLDGLITIPSQCLTVMDLNGEVLFQNEQNYLNSINLWEIVQNSKDSYIYNSEGVSYIITKVVSKYNSWQYISIVPRNEVYRMPNKLVQITVVLLIVSFIVGLVLSNYFTSKNYRQLENIISIIDSAENGSPLPAMPSRTIDEYGYIQQNILKTFIEQSYLKTQLSERKYKFKAMELLALQSQINPHFLYNTLDTVKWMSIRLIGQPNPISIVLENFSVILRYSLKDASETVTLGEEIRNTKSYIDIQMVRYVDKFTMQWEYDDEICNLHIIKLILQPLVENSLYHGIKVKKGPGRIKIKIKVLLNRLKIIVIDNGVGIPREKLDKLRVELETGGEKSERIGLFNTCKRLKLFYGLECQIKLLSRYHLGTVISIDIPIDKSPD